MGSGWQSHITWVAVAPLASLKPIHSFSHSFIQLFYPPPSSHPFPPSDGVGYGHGGGGVRKSEHPVVHPQGEPYIALLLSLFRLPA